MKKTEVTMPANPPKSPPASHTKDSSLYERSGITDKNRGQALVELALVLPLLVVLFLGVFDFARAILAKNIITNVSREGASLAARSALPPADIMNSLAHTALPLDMNHQGMIYITKITGVKKGNSVDPTIRNVTDQARWKDKTSPPSKIGMPSGADTLASNLGSLTLDENETVYVVEVFYDYQSTFSTGKLLLPSQLYAMSLF